MDMKSDSKLIEKRMMEVWTANTPSKVRALRFKYQREAGRKNLRAMREFIIKMFPFKKWAKKPS